MFRHGKTGFKIIPQLGGSPLMEIPTCFPRSWKAISVLALWICVTIISSQPAVALHAHSKGQAELQKDVAVASKAQAGTTTPTSLSPKQARSAQIDADTEKLVLLAEELQAELSKSGKDTLSLQVVKKASEVEKLAKSLKEQLKHE
jgi:hypothetical protein